MRKPFPGASQEIGYSGFVCLLISLAILGKVRWVLTNLENSYETIPVAEELHVKQTKLEQMWQFSSSVTFQW